MNVSTRQRPIRGYVIGAAISALALLSPVIAFLMLIAAEALTDLLLAAGTGAIYCIAAVAIGWVLFRKFRVFSPITLNTVPSLAKVISGALGAPAPAATGDSFEA
jgi:hypothetical protein